MTVEEIRSGKYSAKPSPAVLTEAKRFQIVSPTFRISQGLACPTVALVLGRARFGEGRGGAASARGRFDGDLPCDSATMACARALGRFGGEVRCAASARGRFPCDSATIARAWALGPSAPTVAPGGGGGAVPEWKELSLLTGARGAAVASLTEARSCDPRLDTRLR